MRLMLKSLKYSIFDLIVWSREFHVVVSIEDLKELQVMCLKNRYDVPFPDTDLPLARYLDQKCDVALRILNHEVADLLDNHVFFLNGTSPYVRAFPDLMNSFLQPFSNPKKMQKYTFKCIIILWRKISKV